MAKKRRYFPLPSPGRGFFGENSVDGLTDRLFASGALSKCRNYHVAGRGRLLKREGYQPYATSPSGASAIQGFGIHSDDGAETLLAVSGGTIKSLASGIWTDRSGALTITEADDTFSRWCRWNDGTNGVIVWTDGVANPAYWDGATASFTALALTKARDVQSFKDHVFAINTSDGPTTVRYSDYQDITTWPSGSLFDCDRDSVGMALARHSEEVLLAFHEKSVHKILFNYGQAGALASFFTNQPLDMTRGTVSKDSVVSYKGVTYFASDDGFYAIRSTDRKAEYISRSQEGFWSEMTQSRRAKIVGFTRGEPWNEVAWLVTVGDGATQHTHVMVFNPMIAAIYGDDAGWAIFENSDGLLKLNAAVNFTESTGKQKTIVGKYDGTVHHAFGHENDSSGYKDNNTGAIATELETGFLDLGYRGMKGHREVWIDMDLPSTRTFTLTIDGTNQQLGDAISVSVGEAAAELDTDFLLDVSFLAGEGTTDVNMKAEGNSRWFRYAIRENNTDQPHTINALTMLWVIKGMRIN